MNHPSSTQSPRARRVAVCEFRGSRALALCASERSGGLSVEASAEGDASTFDFVAWAKRQRADERVWVVPGSCSVVRTAPFELGGDVEQAVGALALRSEIELPAEGAHRRGFGAPLPAGGARRTAMFVAVTDPKMSVPWAEDLGASLATPAGALSGLLRLGGRVALACDETDGTLSMVGLGTGGVVARTLRVATSTKEVCHAQARAAVTETMAASGMDLAGLDFSGIAGGVYVDSPAGLGERVSGAAVNDRWISLYGLVLGAAVLALSGEPLARGLASMTPRPVAPGGSVPERFLRWVSVPRHAYSAIGACVALLLLLPLGVSWARSIVLESKAGELESMQGDLRALDEQAALYQQLEGSRWPMTKLLSVISRCAPEGVELESVQLMHGQAIAIEGKAGIDNTEASNAFAATLRASGLFSSVNEKRSDMTAEDGIEFELTAVVGNPHAEPAKILPDYQETPLAQRLYGEGASNTRWSPTSSSAPRSTRSTSRPTREPSDDERERSGERPSTSANLSEAPAVLTDAEIEAMDKLKAMKEWAARRAYLTANDGKVPADVKARVDEEIVKLTERRNKP